MYPKHSQGFEKERTALCHAYVRDDLDGMIAWYIGRYNDYNVSPGKIGKYFEQYLDADLWQKYLSTFPIADYDAIRQSLFAMYDLIRQLAIKIAGTYAYDYPYQDDELMTEYLHRMNGEVSPVSVSPRGRLSSKN